MQQKTDEARCRSEAMEFMDLCAEELSKNSSTDWMSRRAEVESTLRSDGVYPLRFEELEHGARVAWRNNARCIGRLFWSSLKVRDCRELMNRSRSLPICGSTSAWRPTVERFNRWSASMLHPDAKGPRLRIWNHQLFGYAGYGQQTDGTYLGDPEKRGIHKESAGTRLAA